MVHCASLSRLVRAVRAWLFPTPHEADSAMRSELEVDVPYERHEGGGRRFLCLSYREPKPAKKSLPGRSGML
jgi:hypothetical protein